MLPWSRGASGADADSLGRLFIPVDTDTAEPVVVAVSARCWPCNREAKWPAGVSCACVTAAGAKSACVAVCTVADAEGTAGPCMLTLACPEWPAGVLSAGADATTGECVPKPTAVAGVRLGADTSADAGCVCVDVPEAGSAGAPLVPSAFSMRPGANVLRGGAGAGTVPPVSV